jgi:glutamate dehydrogenase (NAD(P)+)
LALSGARVAVEGYGAVGRWAARFLAEKGATIVAVSDSRGGVNAPDGLDLDRLDALKQARKSVSDLGEGTRLEAGEIIGVDCDILIPAARPDVLDADNAGSVRARLVLQGANIPATGEAERILHERGVLVVPDFIANAGGVICASVEYHGGTEAGANAAIVEKISRNAGETLERSLRDGILPRQAAMAMARERVLSAMAYRR